MANESSVKGRIERARLPTILAKYATGIASVVLALACSACSPPASKFAVKYASGFSGKAITASVLGVYRNGLMSQESWRAFAPEISRAFHDSVCTPVYGENLRVANPDMFNFIEEHARLNGITNELLRTIAPAAKGELIVIFQMSGQLSSATAARGVMIAHGGEPIRSDAATRLAVPAAPSLEISASLFSVRLRHRVFLASMEYTGSSLDEALKEFAQKFGSAIPGAVCREWSWAGLKAIYELDDAGLPLRRFRLVPTEQKDP